VPEHEQPRASGITQATYATAGIIGPPLAAPLLFTAGVEWALFLNALTFVFSYLVIRNVPPSASRPPTSTRERTSFWHEFRVGLQTIVGSRVVLAMMVMGVIATTAGQVFGALGVFFVIFNLHTEARFFGLQDTMLGTGVVIGSAVAGWLGARLDPGRTMWVGLLVFGLLFCVYARLSSFPVALGILLLAAIPLGAMNTGIAPVLMRTVPRDVLGRVVATLMPAVQSMGIVGVAVAGWLSSSVLRGLDVRILSVHFGTYDTIFLAGGVIIMLAGVYGALALRGAD